MHHRYPYLPAEYVDAVRRFERFYGERLRKAEQAMRVHGVTFNEMRVYQELGSVDGGRCAAWLNSRLYMDPGQLCRLLQSMCAARLMIAVRKELEEIPTAERERLVGAMQVVEEVLRRSPLENLLLGRA